MTRPLVPGLVAEGETDEVFLSTLITRQLRELTWDSARCSVSVEATTLGSCRSIRDADQVCDALRELAADCDVLFVHNDHRERSKAETAIAATGINKPVVPLVPVRETEAWLLADRGPWEQLSGIRRELLPGTPGEVEKIMDPKQTLERMVARHRWQIREYFAYVGANVDLDVLTRVPAYATWVTETRNVLKGLGYL